LHPYIIYIIMSITSKSLSIETEIKTVADTATLTATNTESGTNAQSSVSTSATTSVTKIAKKKLKIDFMYPVNAVRAAMATKKVHDERRLIRRDELMKQDMERFLMEIEEKRAWISYELQERNFTRMVREEKVRQIKLKEEARIKLEADAVEKETGLSFFRGDIQEYKRYQNSPAKHLDIFGHEASVNSVKLSTCLKYIVSCSADKTGKLWSLKSGKCLFTFAGHLKSVKDIAIHPRFNIESVDVGVVTCSSDATVKYWNCLLKTSLKVRQLIHMILIHMHIIYYCILYRNV
jgi:WD40 repeat protein